MEYSITIDQFEGPLDLLLHLIKESKMDIFTVKIELVIEQYLAYIDAMKEMNLDIASAYLVMASELIEMKSRLLLPRQKQEDEVEEEKNPEERLRERLLEYQQYKEITKTLKEKEELRKEIYTKSPENLQEYADKTAITNSDVTLEDLLDAFQKFLKRKEEEKPLHTKVTPKGLTVEERRKEISSILKEKKKVSFFELFEVITRNYIVVTFLAVLEMARKEELYLKQEEAFGDIYCEVRA